MAKIIGSLIIIISGLMGGKLMGYQYIRRTKELQQFFNAMHMLETEISYGHTLLPLAVERLARVYSEPHKSFFNTLGKNLHPDNGLTANLAWQKAIEQTSKNFFLKNEDWEVLEQYGFGLGLSDDESQVRQLKIVQKRLEQLEKKAREDCEKMCRMWNYIGVLTGIMLVIFLY